LDDTETKRLLFHSPLLVRWTYSSIKELSPALAVLFIEASVEIIGVVFSASCIWGSGLVIVAPVDGFFGGLKESLSINFRFTPTMRNFYRGWRHQY